MPEASDIQQAIAPIARSMDKLEQQYERIVMRFDQLPNTFMTRTEYEARHRELERQIEEEREEKKAMKQELSARQQATRGLAVSVVLAIGMAILDLVLHFAK